jgi:aminomethyltransferase
MPIQYKEGIVEEHKFTRNHCGIFDVSHMGQLYIYGEDQLLEDLEKNFSNRFKKFKIKPFKI